MKIRYFTIGLVLIIFFVTYSQENAYSSPEKKSQEYSISLTYQEYPSESCSCVAFRLDDFSDTSLTKIKIQLLDTFYEKNAPLTIGIIGDRFGDDVDFVKYVKEKIEDESFDLEVANHGWQHENFENLDIQNQTALIKKTNEKVFNILGVNPKVFITPYNKFNSDTLEALKQNDMSIYSAYAKKNSITHYPLSNSDLYHFPAASQTNERDSVTNKFYGVSHEKTLKFILRSVNLYGFAVVMMHPYEFSIIQKDEYSDEINWEQINELEHLIGAIRDYDLQIVTISRINDKLDSAQPIIPETSRQIIQKWSDGSLPDSDFINTIHYLRQEMIIIIPELSITKDGNEQSVPEWLKNTMGWWLDKKISNKEMINGIEYLLKNGIIMI
jgi:peptidoglycan/xylan/chitin deacetylase (PgdA/CDA1 family)